MSRKVTRLERRMILEKVKELVDLGENPLEIVQLLERNIAAKKAKARQA
ncbi:hypothetical protein ES703_45033 [subsurface metagenome]